MADIDIPLTPEQIAGGRAAILDTITKTERLCGDKADLLADGTAYRAELAAFTDATPYAQWADLNGRVMAWHHRVVGRGNG